MMAKVFMARTALAGLTGLLLLAPGIEAQSRVRLGQDSPKLLVVPFYRSLTDSAMSLVVADGLRERLRNAHATRFQTLSRHNINENLVASGFPVDVPLDPPVVRQLARFLNTRFVVEGTIVSTGDSARITARLWEAFGAAPQSVTATTTVALHRVGTRTGEELANQLADGFRSFDDVQECRQNLDRGNHARALQKARDALRQYPGSAAAWLCISGVLEAQNAPADSVTRALRQAHELDTLNTTVIRRLAGRYQAAGDTVRLLNMLERLLEQESRDIELRISTAQLLVRRGEANRAVDLLDGGLASSPGSVDLLQVKSIALAAGNRWAQAGATLAQVADLDSSAVDSLFVLRITTYFGQVPDTAALYHWTQVATRRLPGLPQYWYSLSSLAFAAGDTVRALNAARRYVSLRPADGPGHLSLARAQLALGQVDSALSHARMAASDTSLRQFTAPFFLQAGAQSLRDSAYAQAAERLTLARDYAEGRLRVTSAYFLGIAQVQLGVAADREAEAGRNCEVVRRSQGLWTSAEQNIIAGAAQDRALANQLLTQVIPSYKQRAEQMLRSFRC